MVKKDTGAIMCYDSDPKRLLDKLENVYKEQILPRFLKIMKGHDPDGLLESDPVTLM